MDPEKKKPRKLLLIIHVAMIIGALGMAIPGYLSKSTDDAIAEHLLKNGSRQKGKISNLLKEHSDTISTSPGSRKKKGIKVHDHTAEVRFYPGGNAFANIRLENYLGGADGTKPVNGGSVKAVTFIDPISGSFFKSAKNEQEVEIIYLKDDPKGSAKILYEGDELFFEPWNRWLFYLGSFVFIGSVILTILLIKTGKSF